MGEKSLTANGTTSVNDTHAVVAAAPDPIESRLDLPDSPVLLSELNMPAPLVSALVGETVAVRVYPEEKRCSRRLSKPDGFPCLIDREGTIWIEYRPTRVIYTDDAGNGWQLPQHWLDGEFERAVVDTWCGETVFVEELNLPTYWELREVNITSSSVLRAGGRIAGVLVQELERGGVQVNLRDEDGNSWRLPANWRRRRIMLPDGDVLRAQGVPESVAQRFGQQMVSVNYHPGSLCCLSQHYRFRDEEGGKWPVRIADCTVVGFGNGPEHRA